MPGHICQRYSVVHHFTRTESLTFVSLASFEIDCSNSCAQIPRDLKLDHLVKVISPEGRVLQGRVRYVGPVPGREDAYVGVELPYVNGSSDGTFHGRRFFDW